MLPGRMLPGGRSLGGCTLSRYARRWNRARRSRPLCGPWRGGGLRRRIVAGRPAFLLGCQGNDGAGDVRHGLDDALGGGPQRLQFLGPLGWHGDREEHLAVGNENIRHEAELDDVAVEVGTGHCLQLFEDLVFRHACHCNSIPVIPWRNSRKSVKRFSDRNCVIRRCFQIVQLRRNANGHLSNETDHARPRRQLLMGSWHETPNLTHVLPRLEKFRSSAIQSCPGTGENGRTIIDSGQALSTLARKIVV